MMAATFDTLLQLIAPAAIAGVAAHMALLGIKRGWRAVNGFEHLEEAAGDARERLTAQNEAFVTARRAADEADKQLDRVNQRIRSLTREIEKLENRPPAFVHVLGSPGHDRRVFRASVILDTSQKHARPVAPLWRHPNILIVHAENLDAARSRADHAFPEKAGYSIVFHA
jgi:hypothetical protein